MSFIIQDKNLKVRIDDYIYIPEYIDGKKKMNLYVVYNAEHINGGEIIDNDIVGGCVDNTYNRTALIKTIVEVNYVEDSEYITSVDVKDVSDIDKEFIESVIENDLVDYIEQIEFNETVKRNCNIIRNMVIQNVGTDKKE